MRVTIPLLALLIAGPALADVHPRYHEANKAAAANVVVLRLDSLDEHGLTDMGDCTLTGRVERVERGALLGPGREMTVTVPCHTRDAALPSSGIQWQAVEQLRTARRGRVWLDAQGGQIDGRYFQILP